MRIRSSHFFAPVLTFGTIPLKGQNFCAFMDDQWGTVLAYGVALRPPVISRIELRALSNTALKPHWTAQKGILILRQRVALDNMACFLYGFAFRAESFWFWIRCKRTFKNKNLLGKKRETHEKEALSVVSRCRDCYGLRSAFQFDAIGFVGRHFFSRWECFAA